MNLTPTNAFFVAALFAVAASVCGPATAQPAGPPPEPPPAEFAEELVSNLLAQASAATETNEVAASTNLAQGETTQAATNGTTQAGQSKEADQISQRDSSRGGDRRPVRRSNRDFSSQSRPYRVDTRTSQPVDASTGATNRTGRPDFSNFKLIADRNIFDPNRRPSRVSAPREKPKSVESFSLVGIMSYEKGTFAFFDGSSSAYRKALKQNDSIAGYRLSDINSSAVRLAAGTNEIELRVGAQLRREEEGAWIASREAQSFSSSAANNTPTTSTSTEPANGGGDSDVLKRLRERRDKE